MYAVSTNVKTAFKLYPKYRDSGIEWLGSVPQEWEVRVLKRLIVTPLQYGANETGELEDTSLPRYVRITDIDEDGTLRGDSIRSLPEEQAAPYLLGEGDLLFARSGATVGKTFYYDKSWGRAAFAGYLIRARLDARKAAAKFVSYFCRSSMYWTWLQSSYIQSTIQNVSAEKYAYLVIPVPPLRDQVTIAAYIDRETGRIDELIRKKERQIELLQEKRQALISHAVTKGLDPNAKMKDSGIEWLGMVPEGWEVKRLKYLVRFVSGGTPSTNTDDYWNGDIPWVSPKDMKTRIVTDAEDHITEKAILESATSMVPEGSALMVVRSGILAHSIPVAIAGRPVAINQDLKALIPRRNHFTAQFLVWLIEGNEQELLTQWRKQGATVQSLEQEFIANHVLAVPPTDQQIAISQRLEHETGRIDKLSAKIRASIETLREYRTALISAAVTGQIDVRGEV